MLFRSPSADPSGFGEGQTLRASFTVTTNSSGNASFSKLIFGVSIGQVVTATATDPQNNTSEFSKAVKDIGSAVISGTVFNDANGDKVKQTTEAGLSAWRVYIDKNNNGVLDSGETSVLSDGSGKYSFTALAAGTYVVRIVAKTGCKLTPPTGGSFSLTLANGATASGKNFGEKKTT